MDVLERIKTLIERFSSKNLSIAVAESCTGGFISHMFTNISGSSKVYERGIVTYSDQSKIDLLHIDPLDLKRYGAVSESIAFQMAKNIRELSNVDIGIGITGIAGPTGATSEKPVGLVFIGISTKDATFVKQFLFSTDRLTFKTKVLDEVIILLETSNY